MPPTKPVGTAAAAKSQQQPARTRSEQSNMAAACLGGGKFRQQLKQQHQWRHAHCWIERRDEVDIRERAKRGRMNNNERGGGCVGPFYFLGKTWLPRSHGSPAQAFLLYDHFSLSLFHLFFIFLRFLFLYFKTTSRGVGYHHTHAPCGRSQKEEDGRIRNDR